MRLRSHGEQQATVVSLFRLIGRLSALGLAACLLSAGMAEANEATTAALVREAVVI